MGGCVTSSLAASEEEEPATYGIAAPAQGEHAGSAGTTITTDVIRQQGCSVKGVLHSSFTTTTRADLWPPQQDARRDAESDEEKQCGHDAEQKQPAEYYHPPMISGEGAAATCTAAATPRPLSVCSSRAGGLRRDGEHAPQSTSGPNLPLVLRPSLPSRDAFGDFCYYGMTETAADAAMPGLEFMLEDIDHLYRADGNPDGRQWPMHQPCPDLQRRQFKPRNPLEPDSPVSIHVRCAAGGSGAAAERVADGAAATTRPFLRTFAAQQQQQQHWVAAAAHPAASPKSSSSRLMRNQSFIPLKLAASSTGHDGFPSFVSLDSNVLWGGGGGGAGSEEVPPSVGVGTTSSRRSVLSW